MTWRNHLCLCLLALFGLGVSGQLAIAGEKPYDEPPVPMKTVAPKTPDQLRRDGVSGMVSIMITVDEKGFVQNPTVQKSTNPAFEQPALDAVSQWKFKAAKKDGQPVAVKVVIPVKFTTD